MAPSQFHWLMFVLCAAASALITRGLVASTFVGLAAVHLSVWAACLVMAWERRTLLRRTGSGQ